MFFSYSRKREMAVSTTGIFAMQALMEAAAVAGSSQQRAHADLAKCIWLLTLDGDEPSAAPTGTTATPTPSSTATPPSDS